VVGDRPLERAGVADGRGGDARLEHRPQRGELALGGAPRVVLARARVAVPGLGELGVVGPAAVAVGGEHRADAALGRVGADDDRVAGDRVEHRLARLERHAVDRAAELAGWSAQASHRSCGRVGRGVGDIKRFPAG
jgi:hypothetical protein